MATILTEMFAYSDIDIEIGDKSIGYKGRELIFSKDDSDEIRVTLSNEQLQVNCLFDVCNCFSVGAALGCDVQGRTK